MHFKITMKRMILYFLAAVFANAGEAKLNRCIVVENITIEAEKSIGQANSDKVYLVAENEIIEE